MDQNTARFIQNAKSLDELANIEANAQRRNALTPEIKEAISRRSADFGRTLLEEKTGLDLSSISPAEEKIVAAISRYISLKKLSGSNANRTIKQIQNNGLLNSAEISVAKTKPTMGYEELSKAGLADFSYEKIIVDHPDEFSPRALWYARKTLGIPNDTEKPPKKNQTAEEVTSGRNPDWTYEELILALDLYVRYNSKPPSDEISELSSLLRSMARNQRKTISSTYRNKNGVGMKISNFMRLDPKYTAEGKTGLAQGSSAEEKVWGEFHHNPQKLAEAAMAIRSTNQGFSDNPQEEFLGEETPYWVFVCNPKKWAIDKFLEHHQSLGQGIIRDSWGIRPAHQHQFAPGQLGIVRVGNDNRNLEELGGRPRLKAGIYALCEVETASYPGTGANTGFWVDGKGREPGWPTVKIRYLRTYQDNPLTIERLRAEAPNLSSHLLHGLEAASFPISAEDFRHLMTLLEEDLEDLLDSEPTSVTSDALAELDKKYKNASPEVKERVSRSIERGPIGNEVKKANDYKCQLCDALGLHPLGFKKPNGLHYVEAHHVVPVAKREAGSLSASNVMTLCPNHHRQVHYGGVQVTIQDSAFEVVIEERSVSIPRYKAEK